jgi:hypothetical protein
MAASHTAAALAAAAARAAASWGEVGLDTSATDRGAAEAAVRAAYRAAGLPEPAHVVWLGSPRSGAVAAAALLSHAHRPPSAQPDAAPAVEVEAALAEQGCRVGTVVPGRALRGLLRNAPWAAARAAASVALGPAGWAQVWTAASAGAWRLVIDRVTDPLRRHLVDDLPAPVADTLLDAVHGSHEAPWLATFEAVAELGIEPPAGLAPLGAVARAAGWWWPYERVAILTERPSDLHRDNIGRLHRGDGPALGYPDGFGMHAWHGMPIPANVVDVLPHLTREQITAETNAELRRVMLEHFGYERYVRDIGAQQQHADETGVLWRLRMDPDEDLVMVEVVNSTAEPDGTFRRYWLRVPPNTRTAREGVAWTFGLTAEEYRPLVQT